MLTSMSIFASQARTQQQIIALRAQVAEQTGFADAVRAINNWATAQFRKETPSLIDVTGLGSRSGKKLQSGVSRGAPDFEFVLQQMHTVLMALTNHDRIDVRRWSLVETSYLVRFLREATKL